MTTNPAPGNISCVCGSAWFELQTANGAGGVAFEKDGRVSAFYGLPVCCECGRAASEAVDQPESYMELSSERHLRAVRDADEENS